MATYKPKGKTKITVWVDTTSLNAARARGFLDGKELGKVIEELLTKYGKGLAQAAMTASETIANRLNGSAQDI